MRRLLSMTLFAAVACLASAATCAADDGPPASDRPAAPKVRRVGDGPIVRPEMVPKDDGEWSGNLNFPSLIRVPSWVEKPLGKYYLYFSAHHGSYVRLAYADRVTGPWTVYEPGTLRLEQVEAVNGEGRSPQRHVASPDVHVDDERRQIRMYFHYNLPKLGHSSSVALSSDGLKFEPRPGRIAGPYLRVIRRGDAYLAIDDRGALLRSRDGLEPFEPVSHAVEGVAGDPPAANGGRAGGAHFRHGCLWPTGDDGLSVYYTRIGDAPEQIVMTRVTLAGAPAEWRAAPPVPVLAPEREYEGASFPRVPSTFMGQINVRQLRDPFVFRDDDGRTYLMYAVAGETGIALAEIEGP